MRIPKLNRPTLGKLGVAFYFMLFSSATLFAATGGQCVVTPPVKPPVTPPLTGDELAAFTTATGTWRIAKSGVGFIWTLDENPDWSSAMACNEGTETINVTVDQWKLFIPAGACKFAQNSPPVELNATLIEEAVNAGRWVPYRASRTNKWPAKFGATATHSGSLAAILNETYNPETMNGKSHSDNIVGVISAQGGEYTTSRGAADDADAEVIGRALEGQDIKKYTNALYNIAFASAGYPYRTPFNGDMLRDPQKPRSGPQFEFLSKGNVVNEAIEKYKAAGTNWNYDAAHLANSGWALWLGTQDPRIGLIVQSHASFALANQHSYLRKADGPNGTEAKYHCNVLQPRSIYNCLNAMWRARDVANIVNSGDSILWGAGRVSDMYEETEEQITAIMDRVTNAAADDHLGLGLKNVGAPFHHGWCAVYESSDGSEQNLASASNFMDQQYGTVPAYLRAKDGEALGARLMETLGKHFVARILYLGGTAGVDGSHSARGSSFPLGPCGNVGGYLTPTQIPFSDTKGWAQWVKAQDLVTRKSPSSPAIKSPTDSLRNAWSHTAFQTGFLLRAAAALRDNGKINPIVDLDAAISAFDAALQNTAEGELQGSVGIWYKHTGDVH